MVIYNQLAEEMLWRLRGGNSARRLMINVQVLNREFGDYARINISNENHWMILGYDAQAGGVQN